MVDSWDGQPAFGAQVGCPEEVTLVGQRLSTVILFPPSGPRTQGPARSLSVPRNTGSCYLAALLSTVGTHVLHVSQVNSMLENTESPGLSWCFAH